MTGERTIPILPCRSLDEVLPFYEALGFAVTYRQQRPNPYAVVQREGISLHFCVPPGFEPERSYASAIVVVEDAEALYAAFAAGLRGAYGKLPVAGIPRILRVRRKLGTATGFSVVDPGGNWLRIYREGETEETQDEPRGLALALLSAARQADARGEDAVAARMLDKALARHTDAPAADRAEALAYRAELAERLGETPVSER